MFGKFPLPLPLSTPATQANVRMVFYYLRSVSQQTTKKHVMTLSVCKNVRILVLGAMGSAANVLRAPGSTVK